MPPRALGQMIARKKRSTVASIAIRKTQTVRYKKQGPGGLVHVDIKKLGRIPDGAGIACRGARSETGTTRSKVWDMRSCITRSMTSRDWRTLRPSPTRRKSAVGFCLAASMHVLHRGGGKSSGSDDLMADSGSCYRSHAFATTLGQEVTHRRAHPYRPQTNGKVERFNRALAQEWAYADVYDSEEARAATYAAWLHHSNHHRPRTGLGGLPRKIAFTTSRGTTAGSHSSLCVRTDFLSSQ